VEAPVVRGTQIQKTMTVGIERHLADREASHYQTQGHGLRQTDRTTRCWQAAVSAAGQQAALDGPKMGWC
jgi:hypothetical protein